MQFNFQKPSLTLIILLCIMLSHLLLMWPGILSPDSQAQYQMAISGIYSDHHPPLMAFVWRYLDRLYRGPGMIFLLHLSMLYGAIFYLIKSITFYRCKYLLLLFPIIPQIFFYSNMIWKDTGFTFCFLFIGSYLTYITSSKRPITVLQMILLLIILLYGTAIKFQAQYCTPVLLGWAAYILSNYTVHSKKFIKIYGYCLIIFYLLLNSIDCILLPNVQKNHSWQSVKIYDLAAISLATNTDLFPAFAKNQNFSMQEMANRLNHHALDRSKYYMVDNLIFGDAILKNGVNQTERNQLYFTWVKAVIKHPLAYLKHRWINMASMLLYHPSFKHIKIFLPENALVHWLVNGFIYLTMSNLIPVILSCVYLIYGILLLKNGNNTSWFIIPVICFNAIGVTMVLVLFFCSMAGTPRYTYITVCMNYASHVFAYLSLRSLRKFNWAIMRGFGEQKCQ